MKKYMNVYVLTRVIGVVILALLLLEGSRRYVDFRTGRYLYEAMEREKYDTVAWNLKMGVNPNIFVYEEQFKSKVSMLYMAVDIDARSYDHEMYYVPLFVKYGADFKQHERYGAKMLRVAIKNNKYEMVDYLMKKGVTVRDEDGIIQYLIERYTFYDDTGISEDQIMTLIKELTSHGLSLNAKDKENNMTSLEAANEVHNFTLAEKLRELGAK